MDELRDEMIDILLAREYTSRAPRMLAQAVRQLRQERDCARAALRVLLPDDGRVPCATNAVAAPAEERICWSCPTL